MKKHIKTLLAVAIAATGPVLRGDCWSDYATCLSDAEVNCSTYEDPWECQQEESYRCHEDLVWCLNG